MTKRKKTIKKQRIINENFCHYCGSPLTFIYKADRYSTFTGERFYELYGSCPNKKSFWSRILLEEKHCVNRWMDITTKREKNIPTEGE